MKGSAEDREFAAKVYKLTGDLIASGKFKPNPIKKYPNGLASVEQGFKDAEAGKVTSLQTRLMVSDKGSKGSVHHLGHTVIAEIFMKCAISIACY